MKKIIIVTIFLIAFILISSSIFSQTQNIEITKLKDNFYRLTSLVPYKSNFLAYVTKEGILLVDAGQKQTGLELHDALKKIAVGNNKVMILINTHAHIDHTGGNLTLAGEPVIIGADILRSTLRDYSYVVYEFPDNALPSITFTDSMTVYFGDEKIRLIATPGSHDRTDIIVHFTKSGIVCMGDISYGMTFPSLDAYTGNLLKFPEVIDRILTLIPDNVIIVSGHGRETSVEELKKYKNMIESTSKTVKDELANGKSIQKMQEEDILKEWSDYEGGIGADRIEFISQLANAGPPRYRGSLVKELYSVLIKNDADAATEKYYQLKNDFPDQYPFEVSQLTRTGLWLLSKERTKDAIKIFELGVKEFPDTWNVYDGLGEAYMKNGDNKMAIESYEKSIKLNPENTNAKTMLEKLKKK